MADVFSITFFIVGMLITLPALGLLLRALFPAAVERARGRVAGTPVRCFLAGLLPMVVAIAVFSQAAPVVKAAGAILFLILLLVSGVGLAGLATILGERLPSTADEGRPWRGLVRGAVCLELSFLVPLLGWFGLLPILVVTCLGATMMALVVPPAPASTAQPQAPAAPSAAA